MIEQLSALFEADGPLFFLVAGPNGAGKSTFRLKHLKPADFPCIDPDEVARNLFKRDPRNKNEARQATIEAGRLVAEQFLTRSSFGLETVFSDTHGIKLDLLKDARQHGYRTAVIFVGLDHPDLSIARVWDRVDQGGHDVPDELIRDRFPRSFQNLKRAIPLCDFVVLVDNSRESRHRIFGTITRGKGVHIWDTVPRWYEEFEIGRLAGRS